MKTSLNNPLCNSVFDSRDLLEYQSDLESSILDAYNELNHGNEVSTIRDVENAASDDFLDEWSDEIEEYKKLYEFIDDLSASSDFKYGEGIIHENYWESYVEELCKDCGYISNDFPSWIEIDWSATAENVAEDYITADYDGDTYYIRG